MSSVSVACVDKSAANGVINDRYMTLFYVAFLPNLSSPRLVVLRAVERVRAVTVMKLVTCWGQAPTCTVRWILWLVRFHIRLAILYELEPT